MKYCVMHRGSMVCRTNDVTEARKKIEKLGDTAYIQYGEQAVKEYEAERDAAARR